MRKFIILVLVMFSFIFNVKPESLVSTMENKSFCLNSVNSDTVLRIYSPVITYNNLESPTGLYRHVPSITVSFRNSLFGAYLRNQQNADESKRGQTGVFIRSSDGGNTWGEPVSELLLSEYSENPLDTTGLLQGEIHVATLRAKEYACIAHRGMALGRNAAFISTREDEKKWVNHRLLFTIANNTPVLSSQVVGATPLANFKSTCTIEDVEYDIVLFNPMEDNLGRILIPAIFLTNYGAKHRVGVFSVSGSAVILEGIVPQGKASEGALWEPTLWQANNGTYYIQCRNNNGIGSPSYDNHFISSSPDGLNWTPYDYLSEDIHVNRNMRIKARNDLWLGVGTAHSSLRHALSVWLSVDGVNWVYGPTIGNEDDINDFSQYSDIASDGTNAYVLYSETVDKATNGIVVNAIKFARFTLPQSQTYPVSGSRKMYYESNKKVSIPTCTNTSLTLPPGSSGSIATPASSWNLNLALRVSKAPTTGLSYMLVAVGDAETGYFNIEYRNVGGKIQLWAGGSFVEEIADYSGKDKIISIAFDKVKNEISAFGITKVLGKYARVYLGRYVYSLPVPSGSITYNLITSSLKTSAVLVNFQTYSSVKIPNIEITPGMIVAQPADPIVADSTFRGWFTDYPALTLPFDFNQPVNSNITLYAKWMQNKFRFTFIGANTYGTIEGFKPEFSSETSVYIPSNIGGKRIAIINANAFKRNTNITSFYIEDQSSGTCAINDSAFAFCRNLNTLRFPNNLGKLAPGCFYNCISLYPVLDIASYPLLISNIYSAFKGCTSLVEVRYPKNATSFAPEFLRYCTGLKRVFVESEVFVKLASTTALNGCTALEAIYVPENLLDTYKAQKLSDNTTNNWYTYLNIIRSVSDITSNIEIVSNVVNSKPIKVFYYNLQGAEMSFENIQPHQIYIVKNIFENGEMEIAKEMIMR